jgi:LPS-assembly protein
MDALATHQIAGNLSIYAGLRRAYDKDIDEADWRPRWGIRYGWKGWTMSVDWTRRELLSVEKRAGEVSRHLLERNPEVNISSPWFRDPAVQGSFRVFGMWGDYEDLRLSSSQSSERTGFGVQVRGEPGAAKNLTPFYNATYTHYMYDDEIYDSQKVVDANIGVLWSAGRFDFKTAYLRRWAWGGTPFSWDRYGDREDLYQEIGITIPMRSPEYSWTIGARAAYDVREEELAEMVYKVAYNHHCILWEFVFRDDVRGEDDWMGLSLAIKDLPNGNFALFGDDDNTLSNPFAH